MSMSERQKITDHVYELEEIANAIPHLQRAVTSAALNPCFRLVEFQAVARLAEAARDVHAYIDPYVEEDEKPRMSFHFSDWDDEADREIAVTDVPDGTDF